VSQFINGADNALIDVIDTIYGAALAPDQWQLSLDKLNELMPSVAVCLYGYDYHNSSSIGHIHSGFDPAAMDQYDAYYSSINAWAPGFGRSPVGTLLSSDNFIAREDLLKTEYYADWLRPQENQVMGWGSLLVNESGRFLAFSTTLRAKDEEGLSDTVRRTVARLIPHLDRAFRMARVLAGAELTRGAEAILEALPDPAFLVDADGCVRYSNAPAAAMLSDGVLVRMAQGGRLEFFDAAACEAMALRLSDLAGRTHSGPTAAFPIRSSSNEVASALFSPVTSGETSSGNWLTAFPASRPIGLLVIRRPGKGLDHRLRQSFGLTDAEISIAQHLAQGRSVRETAELRGASILTVRNQLRGVYGKLSVSRQHELVAKLHQLAGSLDGSAA
jgi:DNA-binding CsgD family transcriptional regulator